MRCDDVLYIDRIGATPRELVLRSIVVFLSFSVVRLSLIKHDFLFLHYFLSFRGPFDLKKTSRGTTCWRRLGCHQSLLSEGILGWLTLHTARDVLLSSPSSIARLISIFNFFFYFGEGDVLVNAETFCS